MNGNEEYIIRLAKHGDEEALEKLYIMGGEKLLPWLYDEHYKDIIHDAVKTNHIIGKGLVIEKNNNIYGVIDAYPSDNEKKTDEFNRIIRKHLKYFDMIKFLIRLRRGEKYFVKPKDSYHISIIAVFNEYRRKGIGGKLISHIEGLAKKEGYKSLYLEVQSNNLPAIKMYEKHGFAKVKELPASKLSKKLGKNNDLSVWFMQKIFA